MKIVGMECPECNTGRIVVDNSRNTMDHHCDRCLRHYTEDYLLGYKQGWEDGCVNCSEPSC